MIVNLIIRTAAVANCITMKRNIIITVIDPNYTYHKEVDQEMRWTGEK